MQPLAQYFHCSCCICRHILSLIACWLPAGSLFSFLFSMVIDLEKVKERFTFLTSRRVQDSVFRLMANKK